jgi:hypothetical protein
MCVRPTVVAVQARSLMPGFKPSSVPSADDYARCLEVAMSVREHLTKQHLAPRDLFDVEHFMRITLARKVRAHLDDAIAKRRAARLD